MTPSITLAPAPIHTPAPTRTPFDVRRCWLTGMDVLVRVARLPVLADEYQGMVPLAGKRLYFQPFETKQFVERGVWSDAQLVTQIEAKVFPLILVYQPGFRERWTQAQLRAINQSYETSAILGAARVFVPRPDPSR